MVTAKKAESSDSSSSDSSDDPDSDELKEANKVSSQPKKSLSTATATKNGSVVAPKLCGRQTLVGDKLCGKAHAHWRSI